MKIITKGDIILIIFLIVISILSLFWIKKTNKNIGEKIISIQINGEEVERVSFSDEVVEKEILSEYGRNLLEINSNSVRVLEADCPDKLDVKQGAISNPGEIIICLPNRLLIEIIGEIDDNIIIDDIVR